MNELFSSLLETLEALVSETAPVLLGFISAWLLFEVTARRRARLSQRELFWKRKIHDCVRKIREFSARRADLDRIAIRFHADAPQLQPEERCTVRLFGRRYHGTSIDLTSLNGGLSRSRVLKVVVRDAENSALIAAAAKVSPLPQIRDEEERYQTVISRLTPGGFPQLTVAIHVGAGNYGGLFYGMVGDVVESLFHRIASDHEGVAAVPAEIGEIEKPWYQAKQVDNFRVAQIRRKLIGDAELYEIRDQLDGIDITEIEACTTTAAHCLQHGDLHCANVVFDQRGHAMLIDFGDAGPSFAAIDPVTLELCTVFHSQRATLPPGWPTEEGMSQWMAADRFVENCAFTPFIVACRQWAMAVSGSPEEVAAVAYAYAVRQLKYGDTDKILARTLIRACIAHFAK